jgi:hypothetical protein
VGGFVDVRAAPRTPPVNRSRSGPRTALLVATVAVVVWGALAFGAVYPWAYMPLALGAALVGAAALAVERRNGPSMVGVGASLAVVAVAATLQLVPLPPMIFNRVTPNADAFTMPDHLTSPGAASGRAHPISIAPDRTLRGLALFVAFALFLAGSVRLASALGAAAVVRPLIVFGVVMALIGIAQAALLAESGGFVRKVYGFWTPNAINGSPFGPFINRNHFAGWTIMVLPLAFAGACAAAADARGIPVGVRSALWWLSTRSGAGVLLMGLGVAVMSLAVLMTQSRSGMAAFVAMTLMFAAVLIRQQTTSRAKFVVAALVAGLLVGATAWAGVDKIAKRLSAVRDTESSDARLHAWSDTLGIVRAFPITGTGLNTYGPAMMVYQTGNRRLSFQEAHNEYLQLAAEGGLLLGVPVVIALIMFVREIRRRFREAPRTGSTYWYRIGAVIALTAIAVQSLVEFSLQMPGNAVLFAVIAGIALHRSPNLRTGSMPVRATK